MSNESRHDLTPEIEPVVKSSKLSRIKGGAVWAGIIAIPVAMTAASMYAGLKMTSMQLETAKINLETAHVNHPES